MKIHSFDKTDGFRPSKSDIVQFLHSRELGVIATISSGGFPDAATVAFSETENMEVIIGTDNSSRKAEYMRHNPKVAFVVTDPDRRYTLQLHGYARKLQEKSNEKILKKHYDKLPGSRFYKGITGQVHIIISPKYLKFSDCNPYPWVVTEFNFENNEEQNF